MSSSPSTEREIPLSLIGAGILVLLVRAFFAAGSVGLGTMLFAIIISTVLGVTLMLVAAFLMATVLKVSFGELKSAILKLAAIFIFPHAIGSLLPTGGGLVASVIALGLVVWLFEMEIVYAIAFGVATWLVEIVAAIILVGVLR